MGSQEENNSKLLSRIEKIEQRLSRIEKEIYAYVPESNNTEERKVKPEEYEQNVESRVGEYGLAWLGNLVFLFGIIFSTQYLNSLGHNYISNIVGIIVAVSMFLTSNYIKSNYQSLSRLFKITSFLLLYYFLMQLHFFTSNSLIENKIIVLVLLMVLVAFLYYDYYISNGAIEGIISMALLIFTALISQYSLLIFTALTFCAFFAMYKFEKHLGYKLLFISQIIIYAAMVIWIFGNPIAGNSLQLVATNKYVLIFIVLIAGLFARISLIPNTKDRLQFDGVMTITLINGLLFTIIFCIYVISLFSAHYIWIFLSLFVVSLSYSARLKIKTTWKNIPAFYALYSFLSLSVAVYSYYKFPWAIFFLTLESLLVVSISLWFRAKIIIILNLILFVIILIISFISSNTETIINFTFPIVAILSARIINWQKQRLEIKTEKLRNIYLIIAFAMFLYSLYKALPSSYVSASWIVLAICYFTISLKLKNVKYRIMSIATFISTVLYLFIVDFSKIDLIYRVLIFIFLSIILIIVSLYYSKKRKAEENS